MTFSFWVGFLALLFVCGSGFVVSGVWVADQTTRTADVLGLAAMALCFLGFAAILLAGFIVFHFDVPCLLNKDRGQWQSRLATLEEGLERSEVDNA